MGMVTVPKQLTLNIVSFQSVDDLEYLHHCCLHSTGEVDAYEQQKNGFYQHGCGCSSFIHQ
jgi:hypothetical protein